MTVCQLVFYQTYYGQSITALGKYFVCGNFAASIRLLSSNDGGGGEAIQSGLRAQFYFGTAAMDGAASFVSVGVATPGDSIEAKIKLDNTVAGLVAGTRFSLRDLDLFRIGADCQLLHRG